ncbi:rod-determining factor RdfA [Halobellus captivus]|uniref:rod-determining factor RdfA n=1 Tax=Halobellus captivus TaxID=2592614 RepID=UPI0037431F3E
MSESGPGPRGKVERLLEKYSLEEFGDYLLDRWTAEDAGERLSLRELAREFNIRLLEVRLREVDLEPIEATLEGYYDSLTGDGVSSGVQTQVRRTLAQSGVDVQELTDEFVSRQAIHTYLTKTRGGKQPASDASISTAGVKETVERLRSRIREVSTGRLVRLQNAGEITLGEFRVTVDIQVYCSDCGTQQSMTDLLSQKGCNCGG